MTEPEDIDGLAAEYVLGSLPADERREVEEQRQKDVGLDAAIVAWERRLGPLSHREPGMAPPPRVLEGVLTRIARQSAGGTPAPDLGVLERSRRRWRGLAVGMMAAAASLVLAVGLGLLPKPYAPPRTFLAILDSAAASTADEPARSSNPVFIATLHTADRTLVVRQVSGRRPAAGKSYELWFTLEDGTRPASLGLVRKGEPTTVVDLADRPIDRILASTLAVSVEPEGGAPKGGQMGPVVSAGRLGPAPR